MDESWFATCGLVLGGQGEWDFDRANACRLVVTDDGLRATLVLDVAGWEGKYRCGLFQNDYKPRISSRFSHLVPCDFSGYSGEKLTFSWSTPVMVGIYSQTFAHDLEWIAEAGGVGNFVYGYYVREPGGLLVWAERFCPAPVSINKQGLGVRVRPTFYHRNEE